MRCLIIHPNNKWEMDECSDNGCVVDNYISTYFVVDTIFEEFQIIEDDTMYFNHLNYTAGIFMDEFVFGGTVGIKRKDNTDITVDDIIKLRQYYNTEKYKPKRWVAFIWEKLPHWITHPIESIKTLYSDIRWRYRHEDRSN